jgi:hypothetical protein
MPHRLTLIRRTWRRLIVGISINILCFLNHFVAPRPRWRMHWLGQRPRRQRPERAFIVITFATAMILLEPYEIAAWALISGGMTSCMLTLHSAYWIVNRLRAVNME